MPNTPNINFKKNGAYRVKTSGEGDATDTYDQISLWTHASDVTFDDNKTLASKLSYAAGVLQAGEAAVTIQGNNIYATGMIDVYVPDAYIRSLVPSEITHGDGFCTIAFPASAVQAVDVEVRVRCI